MIFFWFSTLFICVSTVTWLLKTLFSREDWRILSPFGVLMLCYLFYCALGPWVSVGFTEMGFRGVDYYRNINYSAASALLSFFFVCLGYCLVRKPGQVAFEVGSTDNTLLYSFFTYGVFYTLFFISQGGNLVQMYNIFGGASDQEMTGGVDLMGFQQYLYLCVSACVAPVVLIWARARGSWASRGFVLAMIGNLMLVFLATGFRLRVIFLMLAVMSLYYLRLRATQRWFSGYKVLVLNRLAIIVVVAMALVVAMSTARKYGQGVDLDTLKAASAEEVAVSTFNDTVIYFCGGEVIHHVQSTSSYTWFETFKAGALRIIPQGIIGEKPLPKTIEVISEAMGGDAAALSSGFAVPFYIEWFISFGWLGLIGGSALIGVAAGIIANLAIRKPSFYVLLFFALTTGFTFIYFHRGYFPQQLDYFMFMVGVPMAAYWPIRKRSVR